MERFHARYPFFEAAREAVTEAGADLAELIEAGDPAVERGRERVELGLTEGTVGSPRRSVRVELLSYPIARVLVSQLDEPMAIDVYARAEAATARKRFEADLQESSGLRSTADRRVTMPELLEEFDLDVSVDPDASEVSLPVTTYLKLSRPLSGERFRLIDRPLADGEVPVRREELFELLEEAVAARVGEGLPLDVPEEIEAGLDAQRDEIESLLSNPAFTLDFDAVVPSSFPPCMQALLERAREGERLDPPAQFALVAFLAGTDMDPDAVSDLAGGTPDTDILEYQLAHLRDEYGGEYAPPSCAVMDTYELCVNRDDRCNEVNHPATYYEQALEEHTES